MVTPTQVYSCLIAKIAFVVKDISSLTFVLDFKRYRRNDGFFFVVEDDSSGSGAPPLEGLGNFVVL